MKTSIIISKIAIIILLVCSSFTINSFASEREITFTNSTTDTVDDLHIEFTNKIAEWDSSKPHTFNSERHDAGKNNHNFYGTAIPPGGSATMTFKQTNGDITINRWWWTKGGNAISDGKRVGEIKGDNFTNNLAWSGGPATGNGLISVSCMGINAMYNTIPGLPPAQTAMMFMNFLNANFNFGGINRVFFNQNGPSQICAHGNKLGVLPEEIQIQIISMDLTQPVALLQSSARMLNLTAAVEGLYNPVLNKSAMDYTTAVIRSAVPPYNIVDYTGTSLDTNGKGRFFFYNGANNVPYYLVVDHRNGIETWSFDGLNNFISNQMNYNFTTSSSRAYGNNLKHIGTKYCIYGGDALKDGVIDGGDLTIIDNDAYNFATGYLNSDLTCDLVTDATDYALADNNAANFVTMVRP